MGGLSFEENLARHPIAAHAAFALIDRVEMGIRHPGRVEVNRRHVQRLFNPVGVIQQAVVGGVGDHRMHRPLSAIGAVHLLLQAVAGKLALRNAAKNPQRVARRLQP